MEKVHEYLENNKKEDLSTLTPDRGLEQKNAAGSLAPDHLATRP